MSIKRNFSQKAKAKNCGGQLQNSNCKAKGIDLKQSDFEKLVLQLKQQQNVISELQSLLHAYKQKIHEFQKYQQTIIDLQQYIMALQTKNRASSRSFRIKRQLQYQLCQQINQKSDSLRSANLVQSHAFSLNLYQQSLKSPKKDIPIDSAIKISEFDSNSHFQENDKQIFMINLHLNHSLGKQNSETPQPTLEDTIRLEQKCHTNRDYFKSGFRKTESHKYQQSRCQKFDFTQTKKLLKPRTTKFKSQSRENTQHQDYSDIFNYTHATMQNQNDSSSDAQTLERSFTCSRSPSLQNLKRINNCLKLLKN